MFIRQKQSLLLAVVSVCAVWISGCSEDNSLSAAFSKKFTPGAAPSNVSAKASSSSSIKVNWASVNGAIGYRVYRSTSYSGNYTMVGNTDSTSYSDDNLSSGTAYYYRVSACNGSGESPQSTYCTATTVLDAPTGLSAASTSSGSITLSWSPVSGAAGYRVYRSSSASGSYSRLESNITSTSTSYTDNNLSPGTTYYYKVSAYKGTVESAQSSYTYATTGINPPTEIFATASSSSSIIVEWLPVSGADGYRVYRSSSASGSYLEMTTTSSISYTDNNLSPGTTYYYKVSAYKGTVVSAQSYYAYATTGLNPPTDVSARALSSSSIIVEWSAVSGADGYRVYRSTSASFGVDITVNSAFSTSFSDNNLSPGTTYYYKVSAYKGTVESSQSSTASATTKLDAPTGVSARALSSSSIIVEWSSGSGAAGYIVYRGMSVSGPYYQVGTSLFTSYTDDDVVIGVTYYYKVSAYTDYVESLMSLYTSATLLDDEETYDDD